LNALRSGDPELLAAELHNDMTESAVAIRPELVNLLQAGMAAGGVGVFITGSGPTVAVLCRDELNAQAVCQTLLNQGFVATATRGPDVGARLED
jgi:4-diphosphocytidyl-2-C-methyl-D-erythritol kinase